MAEEMKTGKYLTDLHMHLIPHVDDGAENMNMARVMLAMAREERINCIFATPHSDAFDLHPDTAAEYFKKLQEYMKLRYPEMVLLKGCEVYCDPFCIRSVVEKLKSGIYPTMNGTDYVLTEFYVHTDRDCALRCVKGLIDAGCRPIIAHMERYDEIRGDMELVDTLIRMGALVQVNAYSLFEEMNKDVKEWARRLVLERKVHFLGTDAHKTYHRPPKAAMGVQWIFDNVEEAYADAIVWSNAEKLLGASKPQA